MSLATARAATRSGFTLTEREFKELRSFLYDRSGLHFGDNKKFLIENRLQKRLAERGMERFEPYLRLLQSTPGVAGELLELLDAVTTHETSFFRNQPQLEAFRRRVLPEVIERQTGKGRKALRIWSAACSSGEEPYTLAMLVLEVLGPEIKRWSVQILGTDIAQSVLEKARGAAYNRYSFRSAPAYYIQKYFEVEGQDLFHLKDEPKSLVNFQLLNFADDARMRVMRGYQIVFCRNALIYFDKPAKRRFVAHFTRALDPGGYFFAGHSESLHGVSDELKLIHFPGALAYRKPAPESDGSSNRWKKIA
jgi:chemotaxis protein methyltransferase CheR